MNPMSQTDDRTSSRCRQAADMGSGAALRRRARSGSLRLEAMDGNLVLTR